MIPLSVKLLGDWIKWWEEFEADAVEYLDECEYELHKKAIENKEATLKYISHTFGFRKVDGVWTFPKPPAENEAGVTISDSATVTINRKERL